MKSSHIVIIILVVAFIGVVAFLDLPAYNKVSLLQKEIKISGDFLQERQELLIKVNQLKGIYESHKNDIDKIYSVLPLKKGIPDLIVQFEALAAENGLILEKINFTEKPVQKSTNTGAGGGENPQASQESQIDYKTLVVPLSLSGSYESFENFLKALELNVRLADIKSIDFSFSQGTLAGSSILNFKINLEVYYQQ